MSQQMNSMGLSMAGQKGGGSLNTLYAPNTSYQVPLTNPRVGNFQNRMLFQAGTMNRLSDKGRQRMLMMMGQATNGNVNKLINEVPRTGGTQIIN